MYVALNTRPVCWAPVKFITQLRSFDLINFIFDLPRVTACFSVHIKMTGDNIARRAAGPNISFHPAAFVLRMSRSRNYRSGNLQHECPCVLYLISPENDRVGW